MKYHLQRYGQWSNAPACNVFRVVESNFDTRSIPWAKKHPDKMCKRCMKMYHSPKLNDANS